MLKIIVHHLQNDHKRPNSQWGYNIIAFSYIEEWAMWVDKAH